MPLIILVVGQVLIASAVATCTGQHILFLGYLQKYSLVYGALLWFFSARLQRIHFRDAEAVWISPCRGRFIPQDQLFPSYSQETNDHES